MGDRANIKMIQEESAVYLYTHWGGTELPDVLHHCLKTFPGRHDDEVYLASILLRHMHGSDWQGETGTGISVYIVDNQYPIIAVDCSKKLIWLENKNGDRFSEPVSFADFVADPSTLQSKYRE